MKDHNDIHDTPDEEEELGRIREGRLWAPWRMKYIQAAAAGEEDECFLCVNPTVEDSPENLILYRADHCFVIMNLYPYNNGHLMIAPYRHESEFLKLTPEELRECGELTRLCMEALNETMHPHGFNIGWNLGRVAGAGVEEHLHQHIVPRWSGDTNFMPIVGQEKVISESLHESWRRLREAFANLKRKT
jgi:ATP adenylyltransferase